MVEHDLAKAGVVESSVIARSNFTSRMERCRLHADLRHALMPVRNG
ncbi:MAG: hypothetical protein ACREDL_00860 [Bradyrhizobium sp.]